MVETTSQHRQPAPAAKRWRYRVGRERGAIGRFADTLEADLVAAGIAENVRQSLATVLDELLANVVMHAQSARGPVHVHLRRRNDELIVRLRYSAAAFDPTAIAVAQLPATLAQANPGGVGIAMVRAMTREFAYGFRRGENHLRVRVAL
ncbi:MAG TPA: ATP-binding protein [Dokdonella sp.]|jgi:serine/threonine-protein kinase RsbW|nr:ATP-binding protein [Dokdonella sp.]